MVSSLIIRSCTEAGINIRQIDPKVNPEALMRPHFMPITPKMCSLQQKESLEATCIHMKQVVLGYMLYQ